jgi:rhamnulokinase
VVAGLGAAGHVAAAAGGDVATVGVDTWAIDYGLLDADGALLGNPRSYRDTRTEGVAEQVHRRMAPDVLYARNGLQHLSFTTLYQLAAEMRGPLIGRAERLLLMPDLLGYWLSGHIGAEATNASTTGLVDVHTGDWASDLVALTGVPAALLADVYQPGTALGTLRPAVATQTGLSTAVLTGVGTHDTASAVVAVPAADERFAYISCGTWALVGVELEAPVLTAESLAANSTNERGVDGRTRYLRNVMGLWVLQQCLAEWQAAGQTHSLETLLAEAAELPSAAVFDIDRPVFLRPGAMVDEVRGACEDAGVPAPSAPAAVVRAIVDSLAAAFARTVADAVRLSGRDVRVVHLVGGGALNTLLCQLTADACGLPVLAGPVEATAWGNVLVQARAAVTLGGGLEDLRPLVRRLTPVRTYTPRGRASAAS